MSEIKRIEKGSHDPSTRGEGSTFLIPLDDAPEGMESGVKYKIIIEGLVNKDEQGVSVKIDKIYCEKMDDGNRDDKMQKAIEKELTISITNA